MKRFWVFFLLLLLGCDKDRDKKGDLGTDGGEARCGEGTLVDVDSGRCVAALTDSVTIGEDGRVTVNQDFLDSLVEAARLDGVRSVDLVQCGSGTILDEVDDLCRPALSQNVVIDSESLLIVPTPDFADKQFNAGVSSVTVVTCGEGSRLSDDETQCLVNLSTQVEIVNGVVDVRQAVLDESYAAGVASVNLVNCEQGTRLSDAGTACVPVLSELVRIDDAGEIVPTQDFSDQQFALGAASVEPITCDEASGVILNIAGTQCVARLGIDVYFDGNSIVPTEEFTSETYQSGRDSMPPVSCAQGTILSDDGFRCDPNLNLSVSVDGQGVLRPSTEFEDAAMACGATEASDPAEQSWSVVVLADSIECQVLP